MDAPVLGDTRWYAIADEELNEETRVEIIEVRGQLMYVKKVD